MSPPRKLSPLFRKDHFPRPDGYLTWRHLRTLLFIAEGQERRRILSPADLKEKTGMSRRRLGYLVTKYVDRGWIEEIGTHYLLTDEGVRAVSKGLEGKLYHCDGEFSPTLKPDSPTDLRFPNLPRIQRSLEVFKAFYPLLRHWGWTDLQTRHLFSGFPIWKIESAMKYILERLERDQGYSIPIYKPGAYFRKLIYAPNGQEECFLDYIRTVARRLQPAVQARVAHEAASLNLSAPELKKILQRLNSSSTETDAYDVFNELENSGEILNKSRSKGRRRDP